MITSFN